MTNLNLSSGETHSEPVDSPDKGNPLFFRVLRD